MMHEWESFKNIEEVVSHPINNMTDFLIRYFLNQTFSETYDLERSKRKLPEVHLSQPDIVSKASIKTLEQINKGTWSDSGQSYIRQYRALIANFFRALSIESQYFKLNGKYEMTDAFQSLLKYILDESERSVAKIISGKFSEVSSYHWNIVCDLVSTAIRNSSHPKAIIAYQSFLTFINEHGIDTSPTIAFSGANDVIDEILHLVWEELMLEEWTPNPTYRSLYEDNKWLMVSESVYNSLLEQKLLEPVNRPELFHLKKYTLRFTGDIPITHYVPIKPSTPNKDTDTSSEN